MLSRIICLLLLSGSAAAADSTTTSGGYTTLQPVSTTQRVITAPQYNFVPGISFNNCCCGYTTHIAGTVLTVPAIESTRQSWGTNG